MLNENSNISRNLLCSYALLQFTLILCDGITFVNLTPQTNESIEIETTIKPIVSTQLVTNGCYDGRCQCKGKVIKCYLSSGALLIDAGAEKSTTRINVICKVEANGEQQRLQHNIELPYRFIHKKVKFRLENCTAIPEILRRPNISYTGTIKFSENTVVREDFFQQTHNLERLRMEIKTNNAEVKELPPKLFYALSDLKELRLFVFCKPNEVALPLQLFYKLHNLETLLLRVFQIDIEQVIDTALRNLTRAHLRDACALKILILDGNYMQMLPSDLFAELSELVQLSLTRNQLTVLHRDLFSAQHKLTKLDISGNLLQALPLGIFDSTPLLCELILAENQLYAPTNIMESVKSLRYLHILDLSYNQFETIYGASEYKNQTLLQLPSAQHERSAVARNLTSINLSHNRLTTFSMELIAAANIKCPYELDFSNNRIQHIYAATHPVQSTGSCSRRVHLQQNPLLCDCALAWIYNTNFSIALHWECVGPERIVDVLYAYRNFCAWTSAFCPERCICAYDANILRINCTSAQLERIVELPRPEQFSLNATTLDITHNRFYELPSNLTFGYANVTRIYAAHNRLTTIQCAHLPPRLFELDLRNNRLERLSADFLLVYLNESDTLQELYLSANPWLCDCEAVLLLYTVRAHLSRIPDAEQLLCANQPNVTLLQVNIADMCASSPAPRLMWLLLSASLAFSLLISALAAYYKYNLEVHVWLYAHNMFLCCISENELDRDKTFDAFISYAHRDEHFVNHILIPGLEKCVPPFRVCTHERNWLGGGYIPEQIVESVAQSRRTIIVLSQHFIESDWGRMEFRTAHQRSLNEGRARIIIIKYGELTNMTSIDKELRAYLDMNTYLEWEDHTWFWNKLHYAMPHRKGDGRRAGMLELDERHRDYVFGDVEMNQYW